MVRNVSDCSKKLSKNETNTLPKSSGSYLELLNENNKIVYQSGLLQTDYVGNMAYLLWKGPSYNTITYPTSDPFTSNSNALEYTPNYENR